MRSRSVNYSTTMFVADVAPVVGMGNRPTCNSLVEKH
jgi:hypothetical protein